MAQPGFFDLGERYRGLDAKKDPLVVLNAVVPWCALGGFPRAVERGLAQAGRGAEERCGTQALGRKPWDEIVIFKTLVLQALYKRSTISLTTRSSIRSATGSRSCAFWDWALRIGCPTLRQCGCIARSSRKRGSSRRCLMPSTPL